MVTEPDQPTVGESPSNVEEVASVVEPVVKPKKATAKPKRKAPVRKAPVGRKAAAPRKQRPNKTVKPVEPAPPVYTLEELREQGSQAKRELVGAVIEPAVEALGSLSQTVRDTVGGALAGLLSRKRRAD
jgi:hypothetical protein